MNKVLSIKNLSIKIKDQPIIENISFDVCEGDVVLLSGANGTGKSSILKSILRLETEGKEISGEIIYNGLGNVLSMSRDEIQNYRAKVAYVQQRDEYSEMGNIQVRDVFSEGGEPYSGKILSNKGVNELIDKWIPRRSDGTRVFDAKSKPGKFSGGEQRLLSVFSAITTRPNVDLLIIDEPLNNLDFENARNISNLINGVIKENPKMAVLMISHCRIFPFITRELKLSRDGVSEEDGLYTCYSCFGDPNEEGDYK